MTIQSLSCADLDILARIHHAHANALQALMHLPYDQERVQRWADEFDAFRSLCSRLIAAAKRHNEFPVA